MVAKHVRPWWCSNANVEKTREWSLVSLWITQQSSNRSWWPRKNSLKPQGFLARKFATKPNPASDISARGFAVQWKKVQEILMAITSAYKHATRHWHVASINATISVTLVSVNHAESIPESLCIAHVELKTTINSIHQLNAARSSHVVEALAKSCYNVGTNALWDAILALVHHVWSRFRRFAIAARRPRRRCIVTLRDQIVDNNADFLLDVATFAKKSVILKANASKIQQIMNWVRNRWKKVVDKDAWSSSKLVSTDARLPATLAAAVLISNARQKFDIIANVDKGMCSPFASPLKTDSLLTAPLNAGRSREISVLLTHLAQAKILKRTNSRFNLNITQKIRSSLPRRMKSSHKRWKASWLT